MSRASILLLTLTACASAQPGLAGDRGTVDAPLATVDAPTQHGSDSGSGSGNGSGSGSGSSAGGCSFSGALATWDLTAQTGSEISVGAASSATGVTAGELTRAAALTATAGSGSINSSNWATGAQLDSTKYYAFSVTPPSGCSLSITSVALDVKASATGPASGVIATSADGFSATAPASTSAPSTPTITATGASAIELRVYGFGATATGGTMRIQNTVTINGTIH